MAIQFHFNSPLRSCSFSHFAPSKTFNTFAVWFNVLHRGPKGVTALSSARQIREINMGSPYIT